jgi:peroxiredoxin
MEKGRVPKAGEAVLDFELPDSTGKTRRLSELVSSGSRVFVFYRGHW